MVLMETASLQQLVGTSLRQDSTVPPWSSWWRSAAASTLTDDQSQPGKMEDSGSVAVKSVN
jgi:hypothetical protein